MKTYLVTFMISGSLTIPASSKEEARKLFDKYYQEDASRELAMNEIDVTDVQEEEDGDEEFATSDINMTNVQDEDSTPEVPNVDSPVHDEDCASDNGNNKVIDTQSILQGLNSLIDDRKSFLSNDPDFDEMFQDDIAVLSAAISIIQNNDGSTNKVYVPKKSVTDKAEELLEGNEENFAQNPVGYERGYAEGYHDALLDLLRAFGSHWDKAYYN